MFINQSLTNNRRIKIDKKFMFKLHKLTKYVPTILFILLVLLAYLIFQ